MLSDSSERRREVLIDVFRSIQTKLEKIHALALESEDQKERAAEYRIAKGQWRHMYTLYHAVYWHLNAEFGHTLTELREERKFLSSYFPTTAIHDADRDDINPDPQRDRTMVRLTYGEGREVRLIDYNTGEIGYRLDLSRARASPDMSSDERAASSSKTANSDEFVFATSNEPQRTGERVADETRRIADSCQIAVIETTRSPDPLRDREDLH